jgi:site-specific recombinase XerC
MTNMTRVLRIDEKLRYPTFVDAGLRLSELTGLTVDDIDLDTNVAYVIGKGRRPRCKNSLTG